MKSDNDGDEKWMEKASAKMEAKGSKGSFGKATAKNIAHGKKLGGVMKKKAVFAQNAKKASKRG